MCKHLIEHFNGVWPDNAKIYLDHVADNAEITPHDPAGVERLGKVTGHFFVVVYPEGLELILVIVAIAIAAVAVGLTFLLRPSANVKNPQTSSANNHLSDRQNTARPNERIPDIFGQLWATLDLIAVPYRVFIGNQEVEYCYMCIGRGEYQIDRIREDVTNCEDIDGYSVEVYGPNTSPNSGDAPIQSIGDPIKTRVVNLQTFGAVNGQILAPPNSTYRGTGTDIKFVYPNLIVNDGTGDFTALFTASTPAIGVNPADDQYVTIGGLKANDDEASDPGFALSSIHLHGTYKIFAVGPTFIELENPAAINAAWNALNAFAGHESRFTPADGDGIDLISSGPAGPPNNNNWTQKFEMLYPQMTELWCNFVNPQGGYKIDKDGNQHATVVTIQVRVQACDLRGNPLGASFTSAITLTGSSNDRNPKGCTIKIPLPTGFAANGGILVDARRSSLEDTTAGSQVNSQTQWRDAYAVSPVIQPHFGNVTTVQTVVRPTLEALNVAERKLNCLVTRKVLLRGGTTTRPSPPSGVTGRPPARALGQVVTMPIIELNGWLSNGHVGSYEGGVDQGFNFGLDPGVTQPYGNAVNAFDGDLTTFADALGQHTHTYYGCVWAFTEGPITGSSVLHITSEVPANGEDGFTITKRTAGVWYTLDNGINWIQVYNVAGRVKQTDNIVLPPGQDISLVKVMAFTDSHDDMRHKIFDIGVLTTGATVGTGGGTPDALVATKNAADIICAMALDPFIGGRTIFELDITGIYAIAGPGGLIEQYFNVFGYTSAPTEFCYTFDDAKVSFEESIADIATSIFCVAYRRGSVLTLSFEKKTPNSTLLFNHRNKLPKSETRTVTFGSANDQDGINLDYIEPEAPNYPDLDTTVTLYFPADQSAKNPKKVTSIGIRNVQQATLLGWRLYQKLLLQNTAVQFESTQEAALCVLQDRILVADNTRSDVQDGEIVAQDVLQLTLSQNTKFIAGRTYTIFLQHPDATVESIPVTAGVALNQVVLGRAPSVPCIVDVNNWAKTTYMIIEGTV